jgi:Caudovirus prohead serine protease
VSVGFDPIEVEPNGKGGYNFNKWELLELSIVSVPANPGATVFARAFGKDGRVLAAAHADALMRDPSPDRRSEAGRGGRAAGRGPPAGG